MVNIDLDFVSVNIKQLLNSVLAGYEELLRQRFVLWLRQIAQTEALIIPHILREPNSIIVLLFFENILNSV